MIFLLCPLEIQVQVQGLHNSLTCVSQSKFDRNTLRTFLSRFLLVGGSRKLLKCDYGLTVKIHLCRHKLFSIPAEPRQIIQLVSALNKSSSPIHLENNKEFQDVYTKKTVNQ